ncbi:MAG: hypothetical protein WBN92_13820 [Terriglobia bacterium]
MKKGLVLLLLLLFSIPAFSEPSTIASVGKISNATGRPLQNHIFYAIKDGAWWCFYFDSMDLNQLKWKRSVDLSTWGPVNTLTLANEHNRDASNFAVLYTNIKGYDVVHIVVDYQMSPTDHSSAHIRGHIEPASHHLIVDSPETVVAKNSITEYTYQPLAPNLGIDDDHYIWHETAVAPGSSIGDDHTVRSLSPDKGKSWDAEWSPLVTTVGAIDRSTSRAIVSSGPTGMLTFIVRNYGPDNYNSLESAYMRELLRPFINSGLVKMSSTKTVQNIPDACMVKVNDSDVRVIEKTDAASFRHLKFDATSWEAQAPPPDQKSQLNTDGGVFCATDERDLWVFVVDSDPANTIRYNKFNVGSTTWGTWTALETGSSIKRHLSGYQKTGDGKIAVIWTETDGSKFDIRARSLTVGPAASNP